MNIRSFIDTYLPLMGGLVAVLSTLASAVSTYLAYRAISAQRHMNALTSVGTVAARLASLLKSPDLLALHGISIEELQAHGITPEELSYIVENFTMGETYYRLRTHKKQQIRLSEYRRNLLTQPKVQTAWQKIIKRRLLSRSAYTDAVDEFLGSIQSPQKSAEPPI